MMKRKIWIIGVVIIVILGAIFLYRNTSENTLQNSTPASSAIPVTIGTVEAMTIDYVLQQVGTLTASQEVTLRSKAQGRVTEIMFEEGKSVKKDAVLIRVDDAKIVAQIRSLKASIDQLNIRLENKNRSLERNRSLAEQNLVPEEMFDNLKTGIDEIKSQIIQSQAKLAQLNES